VVRARLVVVAQRRHDDRRSAGQTRTNEGLREQRVSSEIQQARAQRGGFALPAQRQAICGAMRGCALLHGFWGAGCRKAHQIKVGWPFRISRPKTAQTDETALRRCTQVVCLAAARRLSRRDTRLSSFFFFSSSRPSSAPLRVPSLRRRVSRCLAQRRWRGSQLRRLRRRRGPQHHRQLRRSSVFQSEELGIRWGDNAVERSMGIRGERQQEGRQSLIRAARKQGECTQHIFALKELN